VALSRHIREEVMDSEEAGQVRAEKRLATSQPLRVQLQEHTMADP